MQSIDQKLYDFCIQHELDEDIDIDTAIPDALGKLILDDCIIFTTEYENHITPVYRLTPLAKYKETLEPITQDEINQISKLDGNQVEYIAMNTHFFPIFKDEFWNSWNPLLRGPEHMTIYELIMQTVKTNIEPGKTIMVVGCGVGIFLNFLEEEGYKAIGLEPNKTNIETAKRYNRKVKQGTIEDLDIKVDCLIDPGVLSANVVKRDYAEKALPIISNSVKQDGLFIHAPYSRSLVCSQDIKQNNFEILNMSIPSNLFNFQYPKQFYVCRKK